MLEQLLCIYQNYFVAIFAVTFLYPQVHLKQINMIHNLKNFYHNHIYKSFVFFLFLALCQDLFISSIKYIEKLNEVVGKKHFFQSETWHGM